MKIKVTVEIEPEDDAFGGQPECLRQVIEAERFCLNPEDATPALTEMLDAVADSLPKGKA